jgi:hypothetical protein
MELYRAEKAKRANAGIRLTPYKGRPDRDVELERRAEALVRGQKPDDAQTQRWATMYVEERRTLRQIAELEGVNYSTIHKRLKTAGVPIRANPKKINRIVQELELRIVELERRLGLRA